MTDSLRAKLAVAVRSTFGGHKAVVRPVPIPNTAVKHSLADGSGCIASARVGCRQSFKKAGEIILRLFYFILRELLLFRLYRPGTSIGQVLSVASGLCLNVVFPRLQCDIVPDKHAVRPVAPLAL